MTCVISRRSIALNAHIQWLVARAMSKSSTDGLPRQVLMTVYILFIIMVVTKPSMVVTIMVISSG